MRLYRFNLDPTATYRSRNGLWIAAGGSGDGILTLTTVSAKGFAVLSHVYGVEETPPRILNERRFQFVRASEGDDGGEQEEPYEVSVQRGLTSCTCQSGRMGFRTTVCKHISSVVHLIAAKHLPVRVIAGS